jgi:hypothetical protein
MEHSNQKSNIDIFGKITHFIGGFLLSILFNMIFLKLASSVYGILAGIILSGGYGIYVIRNKIRSQKYIAWGALAAAIFTIIAGILIFALAMAAFQGIAE